MSPVLVVIVGAIYASIAWNEAEAGNWPMFIVFAGYALSNVGFMFALK